MSSLWWTGLLDTFLPLSCLGGTAVCTSCFVCHSKIKHFWVFYPYTNQNIINHVSTFSLSPLSHPSIYTHVNTHLHTPIHVFTIWWAQIQQIGKERPPGSGPLPPLPADYMGCSQEVRLQGTHNSPSPCDWSLLIATHLGLHCDLPFLTFLVSWMLKPFMPAIGVRDVKQ